MADATIQITKHWSTTMFLGTLGFFLFSIGLWITAQAWATFNGC